MQLQHFFLLKCYAAWVDNVYLIGLFDYLLMLFSCSFPRGHTFNVMFQIQNVNRFLFENKDESFECIFWNEKTLNIGSCQVVVKDVV